MRGQGRNSRKRISRVSPRLTADVADNDTSSVELEPSGSTIKRKRRGRPKRAAVEDSDSSSDTRNVETPSVKDEVEDDSESNESDNESEEDAPAPVKPKNTARRGRPFNRGRSRARGRRGLPGRGKQVESTSSKLSNHDEESSESEEKTETSDEGEKDDESSVEDEVPVKSNTSSRGRGRGGFRGRGRGRGRGSARAAPKVHWKQRQKELAMKEEENDDESDDEKPNHHVGAVFCGKCEDSPEMTKSSWESHNLHQHNNLGWTRDEESPDYENDEKAMKRILLNTIKKKKGTLTCEKCKATKKSVVGFISHVQSCGKTEEELKAMLIPCHLCDSLLKPSSFDYHVKLHKQTAQNKRDLVAAGFDGEVGGRGSKRRAAEKAVMKITEYVTDIRDDPLSKFTASGLTLNKLIERPAPKRKIVGIVRHIWKNEIATRGYAYCRQPGCNYSATSVEKLCDHYSACSFIPILHYGCKICKVRLETEEEITQHIVTEHQFDNLDKPAQIDEDHEEPESGDNEEEESNAQPRVPRDRPPKQPAGTVLQFLERILLSQRSAKPFHWTVEWTMDFELKNYSALLFEEYLPSSYKLLDDEMATTYLPELEESMQTALKKVDSSMHSKTTDVTWKTFKRFEGSIEEETSMFFTCGPVWALAWLPLPCFAELRHSDQYLALSTHSIMESEFSVSKPYATNNLIQIWNVGPLTHERTIKQVPALAYGIAHSFGTIWCLEWCPSGCLDSDVIDEEKEANKFKRMGLLAAACSDGCVHIYSLPFPTELDFVETDSAKWPIYKTEPVVSLVINRKTRENGEQQWQCTKLSWTKEMGHNIIAAGFSNGFIAVWNLSVKSPLLLHKTCNTTIIEASQYFYAHAHAVSMIEIIPHGNKRFLVSSSLDRHFKTWDLEFSPVPQSTNKRGMTSDGAWFMHWPCGVISFDDSLGLFHTNSYLLPYRKFGQKPMLILPANSPAFTIGVNNHANGIAQGTLAGELVTILPHQLLFVKDVEKIWSLKRQLNSNVQVVDFEASGTCNNSHSNAHGEHQGSNKKGKPNIKEHIFMPETYEKCKDRFGIIFCDNFTERKDKLKKGQKVLQTDNLENPAVEQYPFRSLNRLAWNPNSQSFSWLALGYQNGLVRIVNMHCLSSMSDLKQQLNEHEKNMKAALHPTQNGNNSPHGEEF